MAFELSDYISDVDAYKRSKPWVRGRPSPGEEFDPLACRDLWRAVLERAVRDYQYIESKKRAADLKPHEIEKLSRTTENDPYEFFQSDWLDEICDYLQVNPDKIRSAIDAMYVDEK